MLQRKADAGEDMTTFFNMTDQVYARARVTPQNRVCLWLGANLMVEYSYDEAEKLLVDNLAQAEARVVRSAAAAAAGNAGISERGDTECAVVELVKGDGIATR